MLYGLGLVLVLLSVAFVGGSVAVPLAMVATGVTLMWLGEKTEAHHETE